MAYEYGISFELKKDSTYQDRYQSLVDQFYDTESEVPWDETTSFVLLRSKENIDELADRLYFSTELDASKDILLVFDHRASVAIARGPIKWKALLEGHFDRCVIK
jgi:hypothetical protein